MAIDTSAFARAAELLARPLSPTVAEKEALATEKRATPQAATAKGKSPSYPSAKKGPSKAESRPTARDAARPTVSAGGNAEILPCSAPGDQSGAAPLEIQSSPEIAAGAGLPLGNGGIGSIMAAVADLGCLQQELKHKMNSPSNRKAGPPKVKRPPEPKVLSEGQRQEKMVEIDSLEQQLQEAKGKAAAARAVADSLAAAAALPPKGSDSGSGNDHDSVHGDGTDAGDVLEFQRQAEQRVRARRRQEAKERKEKERRELEEREAHLAEAEAKAKALERQAKERVQERLREERFREQQERSEELHEKKLREERAAKAAEELHLQAMRRVADREHAERQQAEHIVQQEAEARQRHEEENEARAAELREKTRVRMQQWTREQREQHMAEEEAQMRRDEEEAKAARDRQVQAQLSQQRARARAAGFRQRARAEEEERRRLDEEQFMQDQEQAEIALKERHQKRNWRRRDSSPAPQTTPQHVAPQTVPQAAPHGHTKAVGSTSRPPQKSNDAPHSKVAQIPPKLPSDRVVQRAKQDMPVPIAHTDDAIQYTAPADVANAPVRCPSVTTVTTDVVQCTVGFFGIGGDIHDDDEDDHADPVAAPASLQPLQPAPARAQKSTVRQSSRGSSRDTSQPGLVKPAASGMAPRSYSQPPPSRPPPSPKVGTSGRAAPPGGIGTYARVVTEDARSPSAASNKSEPAPTQARSVAAPRPAPWRQKAIQVQSNDYYLDLIKASRGQQKGDHAPQGGPGYAAQAAARGEGYADQMRQRANDVEVAQRKEEGMRFDRSCAVLQRVQQRALNAGASRATSVDSAL